MPDRIIVDTSVLIALEKLTLLPLLCKIYSEIILPEAVVKEFGELPLPCITIKKTKSNIAKLLMRDLNLGRGEAEVITLASETGMKLMIDDMKARRIAEDMGLKITGTIGFLVKSQKLGLIKSAYEKAKELKDKGFHITNELLDDIKKFSYKD